MPATPDIIDIGGNKYINDGTRTIRSLFSPSLVSTGTSLHDPDTGADYQVPAGMTFTALRVQISANANGFQTRLLESAAPDVDTGTQKFPTVTTVIGKLDFDVHIDFAANQYVNHDGSSAGVAVSIVVVGVES